MYINDMEKNSCRWYDETSAIKRAYDKGLIDKKWVENYCIIITLFKRKHKLEKYSKFILYRF